MTIERAVAFLFVIPTVAMAYYLNVIWLVGTGFYSPEVGWGMTIFCGLWACLGAALED